MSADTNYTFVPSIRRGFGAFIRNSNPAGVGKRRATIKLKVTLNTRLKGSDMGDAQVEKDVEVYGPGDVVGLDASAISRTDPRVSPEIGDFEPNYMVTAEFPQPDILWRFSPEGPDNETVGMVTPWICLIVLDENEFEEGTRTDDRQRPYIKVYGSPKPPLPDLDLIKRWAHVQVTGTSEGETPTNAQIAAIIKTEPERVLARLVCPRKLEPKKRYTAFIVPSYKLGVYAARGWSAAGISSAAEPAWGPNASGKVELPYYYKWSFGTGLRGDFEYAARQLKFMELENIGTKDVDATAPGFDAPSMGVIAAQGALSSVELDNVAPAEGVNSALARLLNRLTPIAVAEPFFTDVGVLFDSLGQSATVVWNTTGEASCRLEHDGTSTTAVTQDNHYHFVSLRDLGVGVTTTFKLVAEKPGGASLDSGNLAFEVAAVPVVMPPTYGRWHAARDTVASDQTATDWLAGLNLDARFRIAAGLGAEVIRREQNALMISAWDQLGDIVEANDIIALAQYGVVASGSVHETISQLSQDAYFQATSVVHKKSRLDRCEEKFNSQTMGITPFVHFNQHTQVPQSVLDTAFSRVTRHRGPVRSKQKTPKGGILKRLNDKSRSWRIGGTRRTPWDSITRLEGELSTDAQTFTGLIGEVAEVKASDRGKLRDDLTVLLHHVVPPKDDRGDTPSETAADLGLLQDALICTLDPKKTIDVRTKSVIQTGYTELQRIMAYPRFPQPMYEALAKLSKEYIAPGLEAVAQNSVSLLTTNRRFMEAFMLGLNHEFAAELLWREYPTDQRGSYFRQFWDPIDSYAEPDVEPKKDIKELHDWSSSLGSHRVEGSVPEQVVLVIRGDLLKKHPDTRIYAVKAEPGPKPKLPEFSPGASVHEIVEPVFKAHLAPDITLLGFPLSKSDVLGGYRRAGPSLPRISTPPPSYTAGARSMELGPAFTGEIGPPEARPNYDPGYFFVLEERPMESRFGLDEVVTDSADESSAINDGDGDDDGLGSTTPNFNDASWDDVVLDSSRYIKSSNWTTSAEVAAHTFQVAFRLSIHANKLLE